VVANTTACKQLVFLAAVVPAPGRSVREQFAADPSMFHPEWIAAGPRAFDETQLRIVSEQFLFHDCDAETLEWALTTNELCDTRHLIVEPSPFERWPSVPSAYVVATGDRTLTPAWGRRISRDVLGQDAIEVDAGHCPHVSRPGEIAAILDDLARP